MKKQLLIIIALLASTIALNAQYRTVIYKYDRNTFNDNNPLPAEKFWTLNGNIPSNINRVELDIFKNSKTNSTSPIYRANWRLGFSKQSNQFNIPVNLKLNGNSDYSFKIRYYRSATEQERTQLLNVLNISINNYLKTNISAKGKHVNLTNSPKNLYKELNLIIKDGLKNYRLDNGIEFETFSTMVLDKISQLNDVNLKDAKYNVLDVDNSQIRVSYFNSLLEELYQICYNEIEQYLNVKLLTMIETKTVVDYPTEKTTTALRLNAGYAAIYHSGNMKDLSYGTAPYVGISIPMANTAMHNNFLSHSAISIGVFINKLKISGIPERVGGPILGIPAYVAYGYKPLSFMRINVGVTALQEDSKNTFDLKNVYIRPFIGIAFELNVSAKFDR